MMKQGSGKLLLYSMLGISSGKERESKPFYYRPIHFMTRNKTSTRKETVAPV